MTKALGACKIYFEKYVKSNLTEEKIKFRVPALSTYVIDYPENIWLAVKRDKVEADVDIDKVMDNMVYKIDSEFIDNIELEICTKPIILQSRVDINSVIINETTKGNKVEIIDEYLVKVSSRKGTFILTNKLFEINNKNVLNMLQRFGVDTKRIFTCRLK